MPSFLSLALFGIAWAGVALGASLATPATKEGCITENPSYALDCVARIQDFAPRVRRMDHHNKEQMTEFRSTCDFINTCFTSINECEQYKESSSTQSAYVTIKAYCEVLTFLTETLKKCTDNLEKNKSECLEKWNPFWENTWTMHKKQPEQACKNYFGKDLCMEKVVTETCSKKEWEQFREFFISLDENLTKQCGLRELFDGNQKSSEV